MLNRALNLFCALELVPALLMAPRLEIFLSCSIQLSMKFFMLIYSNYKQLPVLAEHENDTANKYENANNIRQFNIY